MPTYTKFQCSVCRRSKDILKDDVRAIPNQCIITKGCEGRLFKVGQTSYPEVTTDVDGLTDWYPRGQKPSSEEVLNVDSTVLMSTSPTGLVTLALRQTRAETLARPKVYLKLTQRKVDDVSFQQYVFKPAISTASISGKDSSGRNLRFDQLAIDENRVFVRVNGISRFGGNEASDIHLSPNTVAFNTQIAANSTVDISVYVEKNTIERQLAFTANLTTAIGANSGSWGNVSYVKTHLPDGTIDGLGWWIYTAEAIGQVSSARLKLEGVFNENNLPLYEGSSLENVRFLLSSAPYENIDRYLNFVVEAKFLNESFSLSSVMNRNIELYADAPAQVELFPPLILYISDDPLVSSFTREDVIITNNLIPSDSLSVRKSGKKIIGPI